MDYRQSAPSRRVPRGMTAATEGKRGGWVYEGESYYGHFPEGHDPRAFVPELQMSSREEMEAHSRAEDGWDRGNRVHCREGAFGVGAVFDQPRVWSNDVTV